MARLRPQLSPFSKASHDETLHEQPSVRSVLVDIKGVTQITGFTRSRVYELMDAPHAPFPKPTKIGRSTRWYYDEVVAWAQQLRSNQSRQTTPAALPRADPPQLVTRVRQYDLVFNPESGCFDQVLRSDRISRKPLPSWTPTVQIRRVVHRSVRSPTEPKQPPAAAEAQTPPSRAPRRGTVDPMELKLQYEAGATVDDLVAWHGIGKATALQLLREVGTAIRKPGPRRKKLHRWPAAS